MSWKQSLKGLQKTLTLIDILKLKLRLHSRLSHMSHR